jgi:hypothetical protein
MQNRAIAALAERLRTCVPLSKSRLDTLSLLVVGAIGARSVNLGHIATERGGPARPASTYRRLQRFFQRGGLAPDWAAPLLAATLGTERWTLVLDRTNWKIGRTEVNYLVLAAVTRRKRVPLVWTLLPHGGSSASAERIALMRRYLARFPAGSIRILLGDREFVGAEWLQFLNDNDIPFAIRLRGDLRVTDALGHELTLRARLRHARRGRSFDARLGAGAEAEAAGAPLLHFAAKRVRGDWLVVCSNRPARAALDAYRKRWQIECLFAEAKTRGLNMEDTRLTCPRKLDMLMAVVALALAWAAAVAAALPEARTPARKAHGYLARSWFRTGLDHLRHVFRTDEGPPQSLCKAFKTPRVV